MFRRRSKAAVRSENDLKIPNVDQLEKWVFKLVKKLELKDGSYTILPAYGGILLYVKDEGITWVPYTEIKSIEGQVDKNKLMESGAILGGLAILHATGGLALPFILIPSVIKGWYRSWAKPSPKKTMTILQSMIDEIEVETTKLNTRLLNTFEDSPLKKNEIKNDKLENLQSGKFETYTLFIKKKYLYSSTTDFPIFTIFKRITSVFTGNEPPIFAVHPQADLQVFINSLEKNHIKVTRKENAKVEKIELPKDGILVN